MRYSKVVQEVKELDLLSRHHLLVPIVEGELALYLPAKGVINVCEDVDDRSDIDGYPDHQAHDGIPQPWRTAAAKTGPPVDTTTQGPPVNALFSIPLSWIVRRYNLLDLPIRVRWDKAKGIGHIRLPKDQSDGWIETTKKEKGSDKVKNSVQASTFCFFLIHHVVLTVLPSAHVRAEAKVVRVRFRDCQRWGAIHARKEVRAKVW